MVLFYWEGGCRGGGGPGRMSTTEFVSLAWGQERSQQGPVVRNKMVLLRTGGLVAVAWRLLSSLK